MGSFTLNFILDRSTLRNVSIDFTVNSTST